MGSEVSQPADRDACRDPKTNKPVHSYTKTVHLASVTLAHVLVYGAPSNREEIWKKCDAYIAKLRKTRTPPNCSPVNGVDPRWLLEHWEDIRRIVGTKDGWYDRKVRKHMFWVWTLAVRHENRKLAANERFDELWDDHPEDSEHIRYRFIPKMKLYDNVFELEPEWLEVMRGLWRAASNLEDESQKRIGLVLARMVIQHWCPYGNVRRAVLGEPV